MLGSWPPGTTTDEKESPSSAILAAQPCSSSGSSAPSTHRMGTSQSKSGSGQSSGRATLSADGFRRPSALNASQWPGAMLISKRRWMCSSRPSMLWTSMAVSRRAAVGLGV